MLWRSSREVQRPVESHLWLGCSWSPKEFAQYLRYCCCSDFTLPVCTSITPSALPPPSPTAGSTPCEPGSSRRGKCCLQSWTSTISTSWHVPLLTCKPGESKAFSQIWEKAKSDGDIFARQWLSSSWKGQANKKVR